MLKQIRYFQSVVRLGSFTAAAEEHFISQSAISQQIKALEEELGVTLLERKKRSFTLTDAREFFYKKSLVIVADYDNIVREVQYEKQNYNSDHSIYDWSDADRLRQRRACICPKRCR